MERDPTSKKGKSFRGNYSLHWILAEAFQDPDAEHIVKESRKNYWLSGYHVARSLKNYYRSDDLQEEVQQRLRMQLSALKYNNKPDSLPSIQSHTDEFKLLANLLRMDKEKWSEGNLKQVYLWNIQATEGSYIMTIKTLCVADNTIHYKETVDKLLKTALHYDFDQDKPQRGHSRSLPDHSKVGTKGDGDISSVPGHLLDLIRKGSGQKAAGLSLKWNKLWNEEKRHIRPDELQLNDTRESRYSKKNKYNSKDGK